MDTVLAVGYELTTVFHWRLTGWSIP